MSPQNRIATLFNRNVASAIFIGATAASLMACAADTAPASEAAEADILAAKECKPGQVVRPRKGKPGGSCQEPGSVQGALCYMGQSNQCKNWNSPGEAYCRSDNDGPIGACVLEYNNPNPVTPGRIHPTQ
jgi:hypothetical protein